VAPALGSVLALDPFLALGLSILFFALLSFTKRFVPTGLFVITLSPALALAFGRQVPLVLGLLALAALLLVAHRTNIRDLVRGTTTPGQALPRPRRGGLP
jgi:glycerol-3-phosphate acyltransferase PlsY